MTPRTREATAAVVLAAVACYAILAALAGWRVVLVLAAAHAAATGLLLFVPVAIHALRTGQGITAACDINDVPDPDGFLRRIPRGTRGVVRDRWRAQGRQWVAVDFDGFGVWVVRPTEIKRAGR